MQTLLDPEALQLLVKGANSAPFAILGPHAVDDGTVSIRVFRPDAKAVAVQLSDTQITVELPRVHEVGFFEGTIAGGVDLAYQLVLLDHQGNRSLIQDPYRFGYWLTNAELYQFGEGRFWHSYQKLGAQLTVMDGVPGVAFAVWAPHAARVSVIGDFNGWDARLHPMRRRPGNGVWELFIPGMGEGEPYQYDILSTSGESAQKTDPYGFWTELRPATASITASMWYTWGDQDWMDRRPQRAQTTERMSVYQVHPGTWMLGDDGEWLDYLSMGQQWVDYCLSMGYTHIALTPVAEYPDDETLGYVTGGFYAVTSRYGSPLEFMQMVDYCHQNHIGVLLDWCPAQFAPGEWGLENFDGTPLYEYPDPLQARHPLWGTLAFNHANPEVRNFLLSNVLFWLEMYHIDGLRLDRVSAMLYRDHGRSPGQWAPPLHGSNINEDAVGFLQTLNSAIDEAAPGVLMIADEATGWPGVTAPTAEGGLGFDLMWQTHWAREMIEFFSGDPHGRRYHHQRLVGALKSGEQAVLALSHKDVLMADGSLINRLAGDDWQQRATLRLLFGLQMTMPGRKWTFMGTEFGARQPWDESLVLDWSQAQQEGHQTLQYWVFDLHRVQMENPALFERDLDPAGFQWIESNDSANGVYTFARIGRNPADLLVIVAHVQPIKREGYRIGVPAGTYDELLNSDSIYYGGSNIGNGSQPLHTLDYGWQGQAASLTITLPPLALLIFKPKGEVILQRPPAVNQDVPASNASNASLAPDDADLKDDRHIPSAMGLSDVQYENALVAHDAFTEIAADIAPQPEDESSVLVEALEERMTLAEAARRNTENVLIELELQADSESSNIETETALQFDLVSERGATDAGEQGEAIEYRLLTVEVDDQDGDDIEHPLTAEEYIGPPPDDGDEDLPASQDLIETEEMPRVRLSLLDEAEARLAEMEAVARELPFDDEARPVLEEPEPSDVGLAQASEFADTSSQEIVEAVIVLVDAEPTESNRYEVDDAGYVYLPLAQIELPAPQYIGEATVIEFDDESLLARVVEEQAQPWDIVVVDDRHSDLVDDEDGEDPVEQDAERSEEGPQQPESDEDDHEEMGR